MTILKIEGFDNITSLNTIKRKFYSYGNKTEWIDGTQDVNVSGYVVDGDTALLSVGRYDGKALKLWHRTDQMNINCGTSCQFQTVGFGSYLKMPINRTNPVDSGIIGFSFSTDRLMSGVFGFPTGIDCGQAIFAIGKLNTNMLTVGGRLAANDDQYSMMLAINPQNKLSLHLISTNSSLMVQKANSSNTTCGRAVFRPGSTVVAASSGTIESGTYYNIEIAYMQSTTAANSNIKVYIDGNIVIDRSSFAFGSSQDNNVATLCCGLVNKDIGNPCSGFPLYTSIGEFSHTFDNFYHGNAKGTINNNILGQSFRVRGIGVTDDFQHTDNFYGSSDHWRAVTGHALEQSFISTYSGEKSIFTLNTPLSTKSDVHALEYNILSRRISSYSGIGIIPTVSLHGVESQSSGIPISGGNFWYASACMNTRPDSVPWTAGAIESGKFGFYINNYR